MPRSHINTLHTLKVNLDFYTDHEALLNQGIFKKLGTVARVKAFQNKCEIPIQDFLNYFLIHRAANSNYATYTDRLNLISEASAWLDKVMSVKSTLNILPGSEGLQEHTGEALGLSVASKLFSLTAADWATIPIKQFKAFDFEQTLTGITVKSEVIQIEVKGSFVTDNTVKQRKVTKHAKNITGKKKEIVAAGGSYPFPATARYGLISSIDPTNIARCFLLDPPAIQLAGEPRNHKVANRLSYVASIVSLLAPNATLPAALKERATLWREGVTEIPRGALRSATGYAFTSANYIESFFAKGKIWLKQLDVVGQLFQSHSASPFFIGLRGNVLRTAIDQNPQSIIEANYGLESQTITIVGRPKILGSDISGDTREYVMVLHTASSGVVIGLST